jgi:chemotaxis protein methyltransferase CheR
MPMTLEPGGAAAMLNERDFATVRELIADYAGIKLSPQKRNMVYNRLLRRLRACGTATIGEYLQLVQASQ